MHIGLFFGSFNPIHVGHLVIAKAMVSRTDLDKVWFVVSPQNPFKKPGNLAHEFDRYDMVRKAVYLDDDLEASDIEFGLPKPSYTVDTLAHLSEKFPHKFSLIMGEDNLVHLHKWKNHEYILKHHQIFVYPRPNQATTNAKDLPNVSCIDAPLMDISATYIRESIQKDEPLTYLVPPEVESFILSKGLYKK